MARIAEEPPLAIVSAMQQELRALLPLLQNARRVERAGRSFHLGELHGHPVVLALSGIGKVAAATTTTLLIHTFQARALVLTGVAGGLAHGVNVGDVVVARQLLQHDLDVSPLFPRFQVPSSGLSHFDADTLLADALAAAVQRCLDGADALLGPATVHAFNLEQARLHRGLIVSGDLFVSSAAQSAALRELLPDALAVEMEGAAVAQVCADSGVPFAVLRCISDRADDSAHVDFSRFIDTVASACTAAIVGDWLKRSA
ncbi:MAG: 5'-methylthioadenosine/adenosylhomocysteine nucleosidase [Burkholderiaceae bacterium]